MSDLNKSLLIGLVDADLLDKGTRFPNLTLMKLSGFFKSKGIKCNLILNTKEDIACYDRIYVSKVFSFTTLPDFYKQAIGTNNEYKFVIGGTGFYANEKNISLYKKLREEDMNRVKNDELVKLVCDVHSLPVIDLANQTPDYHLYDQYVDLSISGGKSNAYKDYQKYSIGFLTRGCIRHCPFCVNKLENKAMPYSSLDSFLDNEKDAKGKLVRPCISLLDDNFFASDYSVWKPLLQKLIECKRPFQFKQGLDERMFAENPHGKEMALMLANANYHGDYIFAFDNYKDKDIIEQSLKIWKSCHPKRNTKFYLFCGFNMKNGDDKRFYRDVWELFQRIKILMQYGCLGYVMRHEDHKNHDLSNLYSQIARWCNQPQFFKNMSFWEFCYVNQRYYESHQLGMSNVPSLLSFDQFQEQVREGKYNKDVKICLPIRTIYLVLDRFPDHKEELLKMFNYKMNNLINPQLWENRTV